MIQQEKINQINATASQRCATALSKLLNTKVEVIFSQPLITDIKKISLAVDSQKIGTGIYLPISGDVSGSALLLFSKETAAHLCDVMIKKEPQSTRELSSFDKEMLKEAGNILLGNYLAVLSNSLRVEFIEGMPKLSFGMFGAILQEIVTNIAKSAEEAMMVRLEFILPSLRIRGYLLLLFSPGRIEPLLNAL